MDVLNILNTAVGLMSLVLGGFAIWLALNLYTKAKDSEKESAKALEAIKAQTDTLQKLTGKWMDRLTRYATEPRPADESLKMLLANLLPTTLLTHLSIQSVNQPSVSQEALLNEVVDCYVCLYYYTAIANVTSQVLLPDPDSFDISLPEHSNIKRLVDHTAADFNYMAGILARIDMARLNSSRYNHLYNDAKNIWGPHIHNTDESLDARRE